MSYLLILLLLVGGFSTSKADQFAEKMSEYYGFNTTYQMYHFPQGWWGATVFSNGRCTGVVYLSDQFLGELGDGALYKGVLAHEWGHASMGAGCRNENRADEIALSKLAEAGEWDAITAYSKFLMGGRNAKVWTAVEILKAAGR